MSETKEEKSVEGTPPSCQHCGKPATRVGHLCIDVHWYDIVEQICNDGDTLLDIRDVYLCDYCDVYLEIPEKDVERLAARFGTVR